MMITGKTVAFQGRGESQLICGDMLYSIFDDVPPCPPVPSTRWLDLTNLPDLVIITAEDGKRYQAVMCLWTKEEGLCAARQSCPWMMIANWSLVISPPQSPRIWGGVSYCPTSGIISMANVKLRYAKNVQLVDGAIERGNCPSAKPRYVHISRQKG